MFDALKKARPVLESLLYHATHTAYHRGQARQVINEVDALALALADPDRPKFGDGYKRLGRVKLLGDGPTIEQMIREDRDRDPGGA